MKLKKLYNEKGQLNARGILYYDKIKDRMISLAMMMTKDGIHPIDFQHAVEQQLSYYLVMEKMRVQAKKAKK